MFAVLLLTLCLPIDDPANKDVQVIDYSSFEIPINATQQQRIGVERFNLFVSTDKGQTWKLHSTCRTNEGNFSFTAEKNGVYWFAAQSVKHTGEKSPETKDLVAVLKVKVDSPFILDGRTKDTVDVDVIDYQSFDIPNYVPRNQLLEYSWIYLYVSEDEGKTWELYSIYHLSDDVFPFSNNKDGTFWFAAKLVKSTDFVKPETKDLQVALKVKVDTSGTHEINPTKEAPKETKAETVVQTIEAPLSNCCQQQFHRGSKCRHRRCR